MGKHAPIAAILIFGLTQSAHAQGFPCQAFQMQPNGMLAVVQPVTIQGPNRQVQMNPGAVFGPNTAMAGINVYALYQQYCR